LTGQHTKPVSFDLVFPEHLHVFTVAPFFDHWLELLQKLEHLDGYNRIFTGKISRLISCSDLLWYNGEKRRDGMYDALVIGARLYDLTRQIASFEPYPPELAQLLLALSRNAAETASFFSVIEGTVPIHEFFDPANIGRIMSQSS
jgi:hypothetical protein